MAEKTYSPDDQHWIDDLVDRCVDEVERAKKLGAIEERHTATVVTKDELWMLHAVKVYQDAPKHPVTGEIHRETASHMLGMVMQVEDPAVLRKLAKCSTSTQMNEQRAVMAQLARIACKRKGLTFDPN